MVLVPVLSPSAQFTLKGLFMVLSYLFKENHRSVELRLSPVLIPKHELKCNTAGASHAPRQKTVLCLRACLGMPMITEWPCNRPTFGDRKVQLTLKVPEAFPH